MRMGWSSFVQFSLLSFAPSIITYHLFREKVLGEVEAEKIRIRTLRGKQHRAQKALTGQGSGPTYGYLWVDGVEYKKERYELNLKVIAVVNGEEWTEVKVITFCYESCLRGISQRQIAMTLTRLGIPTQRGSE